MSFVVFFWSELKLIAANQSQFKELHKFLLIKYIVDSYYFSLLNISVALQALPSKSRNESAAANFANNGKETIIIYSAGR